MSNSASGFRFFNGLHLHRDAFIQIVGWIHNDFCIFLQAVKHLDLRSEVPPNANFLPVDAVVSCDRDNLRTLRTKNKCVRRHNDRRIIVGQQKFNLSVHAGVKRPGIIWNLHLHLHGSRSRIDRAGCSCHGAVKLTARKFLQQDFCFQAFANLSRIGLRNEHVNAERIAL